MEDIQKREGESVAAYFKTKSYSGVADAETIKTQASIDMKRQTWGRWEGASF